MITVNVKMNTSRIIARAEAAARQAVQITGDYIKAESNAIAPLRNGPLIESSRVETSGLKTTISYNTAYAGVQHDHTDFNHPNGRQALYLKSVVENPATLRVMMDAFADGMR